MALLADQPRDLLIGPDNDLVIKGGVQLSRGIDAVAQDCRVTLQIYQGEWFLDQTVGIPYFESIFGQKPPVAIAAARISMRSALLAIDGVIDVLKFDTAFDGKTRTLTISWVVLTAIGPTPQDSLTFVVGTK